MNLHPVIDKLHIMDRDDIPDFYIRDIKNEIHGLTYDKKPLFVIIDMLKNIKFDTNYDINNYQEINDVDGIIKLKESRNDFNKLTLDYKSRDFSRLELNLKRNDNQTFSITSDNTDDEIDYNLLLFIKYAISKKDFDYTVTKVLQDTKIMLSPTQLGGLIQRNLSLLEREGLHIINKKNGKHRLYHCTYEEPSQDNE